MACFDGKWVLTDGKNMEAYHNAIQTPEEFKEKLRMLIEEVRTNPETYIEDIRVNKAAGAVHRTVYIRGEKKREGVAPIGVEHDAKTSDGRPCKITLKLESDSKVTCIEKGPNFDATSIMEVSGNQLTITQTAKGVTCSEIYKRLS